MKKILSIAAFITSFCFSAQTDVNIQNYTGFQIEFSMYKSDQTNVSGGCSPVWDGTSTATGLSILKASPIPMTTSSDAYYPADLNQSNTFNSQYPLTPLINRWIVDNNYGSPYFLPGSIIPASSLVATSMGMKFGIRDPATGAAVAGYFPIGSAECGHPPILDLSAYTTLINASYFNFGGSEWLVFF